MHTSRISNDALNNLTRKLPKSSENLNKLSKAHRTSYGSVKAYCNSKNGLDTKGGMVIKPILKPTKYIELANLSKNKTQPKPSRTNFKANLIFKKSKSADNLSRFRSSSTHSTSSLSPKASCLKKSSLTNLNTVRLQPTRRIHKSMYELNKTFESLNDLNYFKLLELLLMGKKAPVTPKLDSKKVFLKNLFNFLESSSKEKQENKNNHELECKLELMKTEIDELKRNLSSSMSNSKSTTLMENVLPSLPPTPTKLQQTNLKVNAFNDEEDEQRANFLAQTNYAEKFTLMQKQINDLKHLNKSLIIENQAHNVFGANLNDAAMKAKLQTNSNMNRNFDHQLATRDTIYVEKLQKELKDANEKARSLEQMLEEKNKQIEHYGKLFK